MEKDVTTYTNHLTLAHFHESNKFIRAVMGPRGSGKSTAMCIELFKKGMEQGMSGLGYPTKARFLMGRNTYRELEDTTLRTWFTWFPEERVGKFNWHAMSHKLVVRNPVNPDIVHELEFLFRAFDNPKDIKKTLSLELTGAWLNEVKEIPFSIIGGLRDAVGRYPNRGQVDWHGIILDTNPPDSDHWYYCLAERDQDLAYQLGLSLEGVDRVWDFFRQPGGLIEVEEGKFVENPEAENLENLPNGYYLDKIAGQSLDHIRVYYCCQYGFVIEGREVHPDYNDSIHAADHVLEPVNDIDINIGLDFGLEPAATIGQEMPNGQWRVIDELTSVRSSIEEFAKDRLMPLMAKISRKCPDSGFYVYGDPAGTAEAQTDSRTCFEILETCGVNAEPAWHNNDPVVRREALDHLLRTMISGKPAFLVSQHCNQLRKALKGGYCYKRKQVTGQPEYHEKPKKNKYSHIAESCEYMLLGAGEGGGVVTEMSHSDVNPGPRYRPLAAQGGAGWML